MHAWSGLTHSFGALLHSFPSFFILSKPPSALPGSTSPVLGARAPPSTCLEWNASAFSCFAVQLPVENQLMLFALYKQGSDLIFITLPE